MWDTKFDHELHSPKYYMKSKFISSFSIVSTNLSANAVPQLVALTNNDILARSCHSWRCFVTEAAGFRVSDLKIELGVRRSWSQSI